MTTSKKKRKKTCHFLQRSIAFLIVDESVCHKIASDFYSYTFFFCVSRSGVRRWKNVVIMCWWCNSLGEYKYALFYLCFFISYSKEENVFCYVRLCEIDSAYFETIHATDRSEAITLRGGSIDLMIFQDSSWLVGCTPHLSFSSIYSFFPDWQAHF